MATRVFACCPRGSGTVSVAHSHFLPLSSLLAKLFLYLPQLRHLLFKEPLNLVKMAPIFEPSFQKNEPIYDLTASSGNYIHLLIEAAFYLDHNLFTSSPSSSFSSSSSSSGYSSCMEQPSGSEAEESGSRDGKYKHRCEVCSKDFRKKPDFKRHLDFHYNVRPYPCKYKGCGKAFTLKGDLKKHARIHTKDKPFFCKWSGCDYKAADRSSVTGHIRTRHFKLPRNRSLQEKQGIVDERDAKKYLGNTMSQVVTKK